MDNHFVPNLTSGCRSSRRWRKVAAQPLDCHLMIEDPDRWAPAYVEAGASSVTFHVEAARRRCGWPVSCAPQGAGPAWPSSPATPVEPYADLLPSST